LNPLSSSLWRANWPAMRGTLIRFLFVLSVLFSGMQEPVLAHDGGGIAAAGMLSDSHYHDHAQSEDRSDDTGSAPGAVGHEAVHHHHCPVALAGTSEELTTAAVPRRAAFVPVRDRALASLAAAPPLEPPLA